MVDASVFGICSPEVEEGFGGWWSWSVVSGSLGMCLVLDGWSLRLGRVCRGIYIYMYTCIYKCEVFLFFDVGLVSVVYCSVWRGSIGVSGK